MDTFKYVIPAQMEKGADGQWKIKGLASTERIDKQGEVILQKGIDLSPIDQKRGIINFDHMKGPENTIGVLKGYKQTPQGLYIEGTLFKNHSKAKAVQEILSSLDEDSKGLVGLSVEGRILERDNNNPKVIKKCQINAVAVTLNPVNPDTFVDLAKSMNAAEIQFNADGETPTSENVEPESNKAIFTAEQVVSIIQKALGVSVAPSEGIAPADKSGGDALQTSNFSDKKNKKLKKLTKSEYSANLENLLNKLQKLYPENSRTELWECVKDRMYVNFPEIK